MALIKQDQILDSILPRASDLSPKQDVEPAKDPVTFTEGLTIGARDINTVGTVLSSEQINRDPQAIEPDFDVRSYVAGYEDNAADFIYVRNKEEAEALQDAIDRERADDLKLQDAGFSGMMGYITAGLADPINLVPGGQAMKAVRFGSKVGIAGLKTSRNFGVAEAFAETARQATQFERSAEESATIIASVALAGGILGGAAAGVSASGRAALKADIQGIMSGREVPLKFKGKGVEADLSFSASAAEVSKEGSKLAPGGIVGIRVSQPILETPTAKGLRSNSDIMRTATDALFEHNFILKKTLEGKGEVAAETFSKLDGVALAKTQRQLKSLYLESLGINPVAKTATAEALAKTKLAGDTPFTSMADFSEAIGKRLVSESDHPVAQVNKAAEIIRSEIFTKWGKKLQEVGALDETIDVSAASKYFTRVYKRDLIISERPEFEKLIGQALSRQAGNKGLDPDHIAQKASEITDNILGVGDNALSMAQMSDFIAKGGSKFGKERMLTFISDGELSRYLDHDVLAISSSYAQQASATVRFKEALTRLGHENTGDLLKAIRDEYQTKLTRAKTPESRLKITKEMEKDLKTMQDNIDIALGRYGRTGKFDNGLEILKQYQVLRLLGGVTLASLPDAMMHIYKNGPMRTIVDGLVPMMRNIKAAKLSKDDLQDFALANEKESAEMLKALTNPDYRFGRKQSKLAQGIDSTTRTFGKVTGLAYWNNFHKRLAGHVAEARLMRSLDKRAAGETLSDKELRFLGEAGINPDMYKRIHGQFNKYGSRESGSFIANFKLWKDAEARDIFAAAIRKHTDSTILTPGKGDIPAVVQRSKFAQIIFQFKSFASTASNKIFVPALQRHDSEAMMGLFALMAAGATVGYLREDLIGGRKFDTSVDNLIQQGITRSGTLGLMGDAVFTVGQKAGVLKNARQSRFGDRSISGMIGGPSAFLLEDAVGLAGNFSDEGLTDKNLRQATKFLPYQNLFYLRMIQKQMEEGK